VARRKSKKYPNINAFTTVVYKEAVAYGDFSRGHSYATHISSRLSEGICYPDGAGYTRGIPYIYGNTET